MHQLGLGDIELPEQDSGDNRQPQDTSAALLALVAAIRDNVYLEEWALNELLDMQPDNAHAKALCVALGAHDIVPSDDCEVVIIDRELRGE